MRGKQAAKAKNRLANLDNEILQEVLAERDALKVERRALEKQLADAARDLNGQVARRAGELAREDIERLTGELRDERAGRAADKEQLGAQVFALVWSDDYEIRSSDHFVGLARIFGMGHRLGELFANDDPSSQTRTQRRATAKKVGAISAAIQNAAGHGYEGRNALNA